MIPRASGWLLSFLLCPAVVLAQAGAPVSGSSADSTIRVTSRIVYVDVVVHDSGGHLVPELTQDDFKILEDGATLVLCQVPPRLGSVRVAARRRRLVIPGEIPSADDPQDGGRLRRRLLG